VKIVKGHPCGVQKERTTMEPEEGLFLVVTTDTMGKDEELGKILMKGFFETMEVYKEMPSTIFVRQCRGQVNDDQ